MQNGVTVAGGNGQGNGTNQLDRPFGLFVHHDQTVFIADHWNHRIAQWTKNRMTGRNTACGNGQGNHLDQLLGPTDVVIDKKTNTLIICDQRIRRVMRWSLHSSTTMGELFIDKIDCFGLALDHQRYLYVSDSEKHEVRRYRLGDKNGIVVAGGNGQGSNLNQLNQPKYLFVDHQQTVYISDWNNHRVMKWNKNAKEGIIVAGGNEAGSALKQLYFPSGIFVDTLGTLYVADELNHRVMRWTQDATQGMVIVGGNSEGAATNQLQFPAGLFFDQFHNLYVADYNNHRIQRFSIE